MILIVSSDTIPHVGGKSTHILDLMDGLKENGIDSKLISQGQESKLLLKILKLSIAPLRFILTSRFQYYYALLWSKLLRKRIIEAVKNNDVEAISFQDAFAAASIINVQEKIHAPMILTMHTYFGLENALDKKINTTDIIYKKQLTRELQALQVVDKVIAVDSRIKEHIEKTILDEKNKGKTVSVIDVTSIINFTNVKKYNAENNDVVCSERRQQFAISEEAFVIVCARRLVEKNGVIFAVEAMQYLKSRNVMLLIAGDGPQKDSIEKCIEKNELHNVVKLLGSVSSDDLRKIYQICDAALVPSITANGLQEATSISAIEAMACCLPTVASSIGGLKEMFTNGENGLLVDEQEPKQIADAIINLIENRELYRSIAQNSRQYVMKFHSHIKTAKQYYKEFTSISNEV